MVTRRKFSISRFFISIQSFTFVKQIINYSLAYVMNFYYQFIATKSPQACNQWSFFVGLRFSVRFQLKILQQFELNCCYFYHQLEPMNQKIIHRSKIVMKKLYFFYLNFSNLSQLYGFFRFSKN